MAVRWLITRRDGAPNFAMRLFEVEPGCDTPFHTHPEEHEVFVVGGEGLVRGESGDVPLKEGMVVFVSPNEKHQFVNRGEGTLRFLCVIPLLA